VIRYFTALEVPNELKVDVGKLSPGNCSSITFTHIENVSFLACEFPQKLQRCLSQLPNTSNRTIELHALSTIAPVS
jgi:hypothetical protein